MRFQGVVHCLIAGMNAAWTALPNPSTNPFLSDSDGNEWCLDLAGDCPARTFRARVGPHMDPMGPYNVLTHEARWGGGAPTPYVS